MPFFSSQTLDSIADALVKDGYSTHYIDHTLTSILYDKAITLTYRDASIGPLHKKKKLKTIRSDSISWLCDSLPIDKLFLDAMQEIQEGMNQRLFMGLTYYEAHYARYDKGDFYKKHLDAFKGQKNRQLTTVFYLNPVWEAQDAGELVLYNLEEKIITTIAPKAGTLAIFLSENFPHEVTPTQKRRYSIAGWFRVDKKL